MVGVCLPRETQKRTIKMKPEYYSRKDSVEPLSPAWRENGLLLYGHGGIACFNYDVVYKNEYVKIVDGKIIAKTPELNTAPIVNYYDQTMPDGYYYADIYKKEWDFRFFAHGTYKGVRCELLHHQDYSHGKHKAGDCVIRLEGATRNKNVRVSEISFPPVIYVFHSQRQMKEVSDYIPSFTELSASTWDRTINFEVEHDRNNEDLGGVGVNAEAFTRERFLFSDCPATPEFKSWLEQQTKLAIVPILENKDNWDEHQEHEKWEGWRLKSISLKRHVLVDLNKAVREMFANYKGVKYSIEKF